jgi:hypothetical protein
MTGIGRGARAANGVAGASAGSVVVSVVATTGAFGLSGVGRGGYRHCRAPFFQAYPEAEAEDRDEQDHRPVREGADVVKVSAQGKIKTASTSKMMKRSA